MRAERVSGPPEDRPADLRERMISTADQTRETRLRPLADRQRLALQKSRRRDPRAIEFDR